MYKTLASGKTRNFQTFTATIPQLSCVKPIPEVRKRILEISYERKLKPLLGIQQEVCPLLMWKNRVSRKMNTATKSTKYNNGTHL